MGRKPIGKHAMTGAERQRRRRSKLRDSGHVTKPKTGKEYRDSGDVTKPREQFDPAAAPKTWREKYEAAERRRQREYEARVQQRVQQRVRAEVTKIIDEMVIPAWRQKVQRADMILSRDKGVMSRATYRNILACLHTDRAMSDERMKAAFIAFEELEKTLVKQEMPSGGPELPRTVAEWEARRRKRPS
jgi:hypothetical protein